MKKLHAIKQDATITRPYQSHLLVKNGFVDVTNAFVVLRLPVAEVFGSKIIADDEELYFDFKMWQAVKMHEAKVITRDGLTFTTNKGLSMTAVTAIAGRFPDIDCVLPAKDKPTMAIDCFGISAAEYNNLIVAWGIDPRSVRLWLYGADKGAIVESHESDGYALIMPLNILENKEWEGVSKYVQKKTELIDAVL